MRYGTWRLGTWCLCGLFIAGCGASATSESGGGATSSNAQWADDDSAASMDAKSSDTSASGTDSNGGWFLSDAAMDASAGADSGATDGSVLSPDDQQKRAWRKQVDTAPLASVSVGGQEKLELVAMRVTVQVEGLRARTLVDHIFHNPYAKTTEGKFRYALPADATVSYYAMFGGGAAIQPQFFGDADPLKGKD
jgi:hypothetical protein